MNLLRRKSITQLQNEAQTDTSLKRALGSWNLVLLGIGAIIGGGIFVLTGKVAAQNAGPAVVLSFVLAGVASIFAALCYAEFASLVPMAGSAYTYGYATLGEIFAWIIGWDLVLEYALGAVTVAISWSGYCVSFLDQFGIHIPPEWAAPRGAEIKLPDGTVTTGIFNVPAIFIIAFVTTLLVIGIRESANLNNVVVVIKVAVVLLFIGGAIRAVTAANWAPFMPPAEGPGHFGWSGVVRGAGVVFFAYIGFDAVSTAAQEARNPQRDMPRGIIGSLLICTVLYIIVSGIATGVVPYKDLNVSAPIALAAERAGMGRWMTAVIKIGALAGLSSVILVMLLGQSRVFWAMSRDGLLPAIVARVHPKFKTPWITTIVTGGAVAIVSTLIDLSFASELVSIGTLLAFVIVSIGVLVLRIKQPELPRSFKTPAVWVTAPLGALTALYLMIGLPGETWLRLVIWFVIGMIIYFTYSVRHSILASKTPQPSAPPTKP